MENYEILGKVGEGFGQRVAALLETPMPLGACFRARRSHSRPPFRARLRTYGIVLKCRHKESGQLVAIKIFKESDEDEQVRPRVRSPP